MGPAEAFLGGTDGDINRAAPTNTRACILYFGGICGNWFQILAFLLALVIGTRGDVRGGDFLLWSEGRED